MPTKVHDVEVKSKSVTLDELTSFFDSIEIQTKLNKRCWSGSFFKPLQSDKSKIVGQSIVDLEAAIVNLAFKTRQGLNIQAARMIAHTASELGKTAPSIVNSGYDIRRTDRYFCCDFFYNSVLGVTLIFHTFVIYHSSQISSETLSRIKEMNSNKQKNSVIIWR